MKIRLYAAGMIALLVITMLAGCAASANEIQPQSPAESTAPPAATAEPAVVQPPATAARISAEEAEAIVLQHAGVTADQVSYMRTEFDYDDGRPEYDIEFRRDGWEYDYEIHAETGEILRYESEPPKQKQATVPPAPETQPRETTAPRKDQLSREEAIAIALNHAGLTESQVKGLKAELDWDDGVPEYEVEFRCGGYEYDYDIHAETGKIRSWDKDWDD